MAKSNLVASFQGSTLIVREANSPNYIAVSIENGKLVYHKSIEGRVGTAADHLFTAVKDFITKYCRNRRYGNAKKLQMAYALIDKAITRGHKDTYAKLANKFIKLTVPQTTVLN